MIPTPEQIKLTRKEAGLSQTAAAQLVHTALRTWQQWEAGDRAMHAGLWELFCLKVAAPAELYTPGRCRLRLIEEGKVDVPRTCKRCGLGPCQFKR